MLTSLKSLWRSRSKTTRPRGRLRPTVEALEDRLTPSGAGMREQYMLELMNRMRENPAAELPRLLNSPDPDVQFALSYFKVNKQVLTQQWSTLTPAPPLAWSDALASASLDHSKLMLQDNQQSHQLPGEPAPAARDANAGFIGSAGWENCFAYATSIFDCYASWAIDWTNANSNGIQNPPGHRNNIMNASLRQVGIGVVDGPGTGNGTLVGPLAVTADFGTPTNVTPYLLGVVFKDPQGYYLSGVNAEYMFSQGEGLAGVTLTIKGPGGTFTTTTAAAGGYQIQLPPGDYSVTASGGAFGPTQTRWVTVGSQNVHLDFASVASSSLTTAPTLTGPASAKPSAPVTISWTPVPKASSYRIYVTWQSPPLGNPQYPYVQGCEWVMNVSGTSYTWPAGMPQGAGTYWITIYAVDASGYESPVSNTLVLNVTAKSGSGGGSGHLGTAASAFTHSAEYYTNLVTATYQKYLHRAPDGPGLAGWVRGMQAGLTDEQLEAFFIGSAEYIASRGAGPGHWAPWVTSMYQDLLGRTPSPAEVQQWVNGLDLGISTTYVAHGFAASAERETLRVTADYLNYLGRAPTAAEVAQWVKAFEQGWITNEDVLAGFVGSAEYFQKHGAIDWGWLRTAYQDILGRRPDDAGFGAWMRYLDSN